MPKKLWDIELLSLGHDCLHDYKIQGLKRAPQMDILTTEIWYVLNSKYRLRALTCTFSTQYTRSLYGVEDKQQMGQSYFEGMKQSIPEIMAQSDGRACTVAMLTNYRVVILNDCADSPRIMIVAIVERHLLLLHALDGSMTSNPVEGIQGNSRGGSSITALEHFGIGKPSWSVIIKQSRGKSAAVNRDERVALVTCHMWAK
jgi:hypothetical protein